MKKIGFMWPVVLGPDASWCSVIAIMTLPLFFWSAFKNHLVELLSSLFRYHESLEKHILPWVLLFYESKDKVFLYVQAPKRMLLRMACSAKNADYFSFWLSGWLEKNNCITGCILYYLENTAINKKAIKRKTVLTKRVFLPKKIFPASEKLVNLITSGSGFALAGIWWFQVASGSTSDHFRLVPVKTQLEVI